MPSDDWDGSINNIAVPVTECTEDSDEAGNSNTCSTNSVLYYAYSVLVAQMTLTRMMHFNSWPR